MEFGAWGFRFWGSGSGSRFRFWGLGWFRAYRGRDNALSSGLPTIKKSSPFVGFKARPGGPGFGAWVEGLGFGISEGVLAVLHEFLTINWGFA